MIGEAVADAEGIAEGIGLVFEQVGDHRADRAAEFEAVAAAAAGDEDAVGDPVDDVVVVGGVGIEAGATPDELGVF